MRQLQCWQPKNFDQIPLLMADNKTSPLGNFGQGVVGSTVVGRIFLLARIAQVG